MKHLTLEEKYNRIRQACLDEETGRFCSFGIHAYGLLHEIADALGLKNNSGGELRNLTNNINRITRQLIKAGYPIKEGRIKCCSWSPWETWHPIFYWED